MHTSITYGGYQRSITLVPFSLCNPLSSLEFDKAFGFVAHSEVVLKPSLPILI